MTRYVVDASAAVEYLLKTPLGKNIAAATEHSILVAPELMDAEVVAVLRRAVLREELSEDRALLALDDLTGSPVERISHRALAKSAWRHRDNPTAHDAFYVATVRAWDAALLTADGPLSRAPRLGITVHNVRLA